MAYSRGSLDSPLIEIIQRNFDALKDVDFSAFLFELRSTEYDVSAEDLVLMESLTGELEKYWQETHQMKDLNTRIAKSMQLPAIVLYEMIAKTFPLHEREVVHYIWESYLRMENGNICLYNNPPNRIKAGFSRTIADLGDALLYLQYGRPREFKGRMVEAENTALHTAEEMEYRKLAQDFVEHVGDIAKAKQLVAALASTGKETIKQLQDDLDTKGYWVTQDYLSSGGLLDNFIHIFAREFEEYVP